MTFDKKHVIPQRWPDAEIVLVKMIGRFMKPLWVTERERLNAERRARAKADAERLDTGHEWVEGMELGNGKIATLHNYAVARVGRRIMHNASRSRGASVRRMKKTRMAIVRRSRDKKRIES